MLYTPAYHAHTDTAPTGTEWVLDGNPLQCDHDPSRGGPHADSRRRAPCCRSAALKPDRRIGRPGSRRRGRFLPTDWKSAFGTLADSLDTPPHIINGAGLCVATARRCDWTGGRPRGRGICRGATPANAHRRGRDWRRLAGGRRRPPARLQHRHDVRRSAAAGRTAGPDRCPQPRRWRVDDDGGRRSGGQQALGPREAGRWRTRSSSQPANATAGRPERLAE